MPSNECPECGALPGQFHRPRCEVEVCPYCGDQLVRCSCANPYPPLDDRLRWTGVFPGVEECEAFGWYAHLVPGRGWVPCGPNDPAAEADLYRLYQEALWDRDHKRWVLAEDLLAERMKDEG
jgi:hypothetical protein